MVLSQLNDRLIEHVVRVSTKNPLFMCRLMLVIQTQVRTSMLYVPESGIFD